MGPWPRLSQSLEGPLSSRDPEAREPLDRAALKAGAVLDLLVLGKKCSWVESAPARPTEMSRKQRCVGLGPASLPTKQGQRRVNCREEDCSATGKVFTDLTLEVNRAPEPVRQRGHLGSQCQACSQ